MADLKIFTENVTPKAVNQIYTLLSQPTFQNEKVRIMPDVHVGKGCVVGFTGTITDKIIPNVIGVDIGCGMLCVELGKLDFSPKALDEFIKKNIPAGSAINKEVDGEELIKSLYCFDELRNMDRLYGSLGSLGGGNHFIEIDEDEDGCRYLVIHSGSRNLGQQVANVYQKIAIKCCKEVSQEEREALITRLKEESRVEDIPTELENLTKKYAYKTKIPNELCYLDGIEMDKYMHDMRICQEFAVKNRAKIAGKILKYLGVLKATSFETVHNFIDENNIVRKGAIPAHLGQKVLIPMNMRDGCLVCEGLGNEDWNNSAPHGAGRLFSRSDAKELLTVEEFQDAMQGIYTTTATSATLDEAPMAYKPMEEIISLIAPTVRILKIIKPIYNFKASD